MRNKYVTLVDTSGYFVFQCSSVFEMKADYKVGPYKQIDFPKDKLPVICFSLVHSDLDTFLTKVEAMRIVMQNSGTRRQSRLDVASAGYNISEILSGASFDTSLLVDFHEKLLMRDPIPVKKVSPLILNPGCLMMTSSRVYFQPAQLNNVGDKVLHFEILGVSRIYRRRFLLMNTALEFVLSDGNSVLFTFDERSTRDFVYNILVSQPHLSHGERHNTAHFE